MHTWKIRSSTTSVHLWYNIFNILRFGMLQFQSCTLFTVDSVQIWMWHIAVNTGELIQLSVNIDDRFLWGLLVQALTGLSNRTHSCIDIGPSPLLQAIKTPLIPTSTRWPPVKWSYSSVTPAGERHAQTWPLYLLNDCRWPWSAVDVNVGHLSFLACGVPRPRRSALSLLLLYARI